MKRDMSVVGIEIAKRVFHLSQILGTTLCQHGYHHGCVSNNVRPLGATRR